MQRLGIFLLSAAALAFEINLTRLFSVAQFYHFAFMTVSLALLGFGASGTLLTLSPGLARRPRSTLVACGWGFALSAVGSYLFTLYLPFDSFRVSIAPGQWGVLALHYLALAAPFSCAGIAVGLWLMVEPQATGRTYAANLVGSAVGCLLAVILPVLSGAVGVVLICAALALLAALVFALTGDDAAALRRCLRARHLLSPSLAVVLLVIAVRPPAFLEPRLSPYKSLSNTLQLPDAQLLFRDWNNISRVDVVASSAIRSMPGQGFACSQAPPPQRGLFVDGDDLSPITRLSDPADLRPLTDCLLTALPYRLRPAARTAVLNPRGGFDLWVALAEGAQTVTAVEPNPLLVQAVREQGEWAGNLYDRPDVTLFVEEERAFLARPGPRYDVLVLPSPGTYHPVTSGAYSLAEDYRYTVEGFTAALSRLDEDGLLVVIRWLQAPPSEEVRAFALAVTALERLGSDPAQSLAALRSYSQMLILARRGPFTPEEIGTVRDFAAARAFDLVYVPGVRPDEINRYNLLASPDDYLACVGLLTAEDRAGWLTDYPFDITPPTDDRPFFGHFFRWQQAGEVLAMAGHVWQPFGGAGYLVLLAMLAVATLAAGALVLLPLAARRNDPTETVPVGNGRGSPQMLHLLPFAFLGMAYLLVEIPLLQRFILFLGHPTYAMAAVLGTLLLFSGLGSRLSSRAPRRAALLALVGLLVFYRFALPFLSGPLLGWPLAARATATVAWLAPLGVLMGVPFPASLALLQQKAPGLLPWAWGVNGALSVVASVLAALLALSWGFGSVLLLGAACYLTVWLTTPNPAIRRGPAASSARWRAR